MILYVSPYPPDRVRDEPVSLGRIKASYGLHKSYVAFLDKIHGVYVIVFVFVRDAHDELQV